MHIAPAHPTAASAIVVKTERVSSPAFLNDRSAAALIGLSREKVRQLRLRGVLAFTQEGRNIQIPREVVDEYIESKRADAQEECLRRARLSGRIDPANAPYMGLIYRTNKRRPGRTNDQAAKGL